MLYNAKSFVYAGTSSNDFNISIGYFDSPDFDNNGLKREVSKSETSMLRRRANVYGVNSEDPITFTFSIYPYKCGKDINPEWNVVESRQINMWLLSPTTPQTLIFEDDNDVVTVRFKAVVTSIEDIPGSIGCAGKTITFECDAPFGYSAPQIYRGTCNGTQSIIIEDIGDEEYTYADYEIHFRNSYPSNIEIYNATTGDKLEFKNDYQYIKYDGKKYLMTDANGEIIPLYKILISSENPHTSLRLKKGENSIQMSGNFDYKITVTYAMRVGIM